MRRSLLFAGLTAVLLLSSCASVGGAFITKELAGEYYALAEGYAGLSKYEKAIAYYRKASQRKEFYSASQYGLARMYVLSGKPDEACPIFSALLKKDPENTLVRSALAYALALSGKMDESLALYTAIYQKSNDDPVIARNYAEILFLAKRYEDSLAQIAVLKDRFPDTDALKDIALLEKKIQDATKPPEEKIESPEGEKKVPPAVENKGD